MLFFLHATNFDRVFENFLRALLERGHSVEVLVDIEKRRSIQGSGLAFDRLEAEYPERFSSGIAPQRSEPWLKRATAWRLALDWLRFLEPEFEHATALRDRARRRAPRLLRLLVERAPARMRSRVVGRLRAAEAALPVSEHVRELIASRSPDVVLVSPLVGLGSMQADYLRAARSLGIPIVLPVASWDNLTNKGRLRDVPDRTIVWNALQVEEAVRLHDLPEGDRRATGAHAFDHWFSWDPSTTYAEFAAKVGISAEKPMILYVGSSTFVARDEVSFVRDWVAALRASRHEELRRCSVVARPHPQHAAQWADVDLGPGVVVFPQGGVAPIAEPAKADYYDSLHHCCAVVGINTSAQIEAAIVRRPVLTFLDERFKATQEGTLHFAYLTGSDQAGVVTVAQSTTASTSSPRRSPTPDASRPRLEAFLRGLRAPTRARRAGLRPARPVAIERAASGQSAQPGCRPRRLRGFRGCLGHGRTRPCKERLSVDVSGRRMASNPIARHMLHLVRLPARSYRKTRVKLGEIAGRG